MFLVNIVCQMDNLPLQLFTDRNAAIKFGRSHELEVPQKVLDIFRIDPPTVLGIELVEFDAENMPIRREILRWFSDEGAAA